MISTDRPETESWPYGFLLHHLAHQYSIGTIFLFDDEEIQVQRENRLNLSQRLKLV